MAEVLTLGEALVAIRAHGRLSLGDRLSASPAGAEMNVAIGLSRLGHAVNWVGTVGADPAGDLILRELRAEAVGTDGVRRDPDAPTAIMLVDMPAALPPVVTYHRRHSAGSLLSAADVDAAVVGSARLLHLSGITPALSATAHDAARAAIDAARDAGVLVSFDVNYRSKLWDRAAAAEALAPLAREADVVIASEDELELVAAGPDEAARVMELLGGRPREVIIKRGSRGATYQDARERVSCAARPVAEVNSIGAGDAFTAGYLSGLLDGLPPAERLRRGAACGALAVTGVGDWEQAPTRRDLALLEGDGDVVR